MPDLLYEKSDHVGVITLNRPERMNAISVAMLESLSAALDDADRDGEVRAIIITGAGRGFCSGLDIKDAMAGKGIGGSGALAPGGGAAHFGTARAADGHPARDRHAGALRDQRPGRRLRPRPRPRLRHAADRRHRDAWCPASPSAASCRRAAAPGTCRASSAGRRRARSVSSPTTSTPRARCRARPGERGRAGRPACSTRPIAGRPRSPPTPRWRSGR